MSDLTERELEAMRRPMDGDREHFRSAKRRADKARDFPTHTDPCSRHAYIMADCMVKKRGYPMLAEEPWHCAISIMATVAALWEARAALAKAERKAPSLTSEPDVQETPIECIKNIKDAP